MQLTRFSDLGLRTLMYLTRESRALPVTISEIAGEFAVPQNHLIKVANKLAKLGWISALRGRNGGLRLIVPAASLRLGAVLRQLEGSTELIDCDQPPCPLSGRCLLKRALNVGLDTFYQTMDDYSLADVSKGRTGSTIDVMHQHFLKEQTRQR
ncbi:MAG: Rrf2 family transcriptional regulator [Gammaproteobacteria bacterium]|nr:Rrf2 family transcriptional regulator [Gammaproteobacteria bacterium]